MYLTACISKNTRLMLPTDNARLATTHDPYHLRSGSCVRRSFNRDLRQKCIALSQKFTDCMLLTCFLRFLSAIFLLAGKLALLVPLLHVRLTRSRLVLLLALFAQRLRRVCIGTSMC